MEKCSIENCKNECFEQEDKCILHCNESILINYLEKNINDDNTLVLDKIDFLENFNYQIIFDKSQAIEFWNCTFYNIENQINILNHYRIHFYECKFNKRWIHLDIDDIVYSNCDFYDEIFFDRDSNNGENKIYTVAMHDCNVYKRFDLDFDAVNLEQCNIRMLHLDNSVFHEKVKIKNCNIENHSFINTRFKSLADFYKTEFYNNSFYKTTFKDIVVFTESKFHKNVNFQYTTFEKLALFRKTVFEKTVNFEDSIFKEEANFLGLTANVASRETARIIKNSFEQQNNIIEANKFYKLEMKKREEELAKDIENKEKRDLKTYIDYIIFKFHGISSNHSQDPISTIIWIFSISFFYLTIIQINFQDYSFENWMYYHSVNIMGILITLALFYKKCGISYICKILYVGVLQLYYLKFISDCSYASLFNTVADKINPTSEEPITFGLLMFKITIAYLIYQFIVSVRQNTRRK